MSERPFLSLRTAFDSPLVPSLPVSLSPSSEAARAVRFEDTCTLIPESQLSPSKRPLFVKKSYSLPLWKKKAHSGGVASSDSEVDADDVVKLKVSVPRLRKISASPSREAPPPLVSCLVNRQRGNHPRSASDSQFVPVASTSPPHTHTLHRRPSQPLLNSRGRHDPVTVPLRACCPDCLAVTEGCMRAGARWDEKFTRGAWRKRSASLESGSVPGPGPIAGFFAVAVDEVEKRRVSHDEDIDALALTPEWRDAGPSTSADTWKAQGIAHLPCPPRIEEEDEDQLFPLPSPRRSPSGSPAPSPSQSTTSLSPRGSRQGSQESVVSNIQEGGRCSKGLLTPPERISTPPVPTPSPPSTFSAPTLPIAIPSTSSGVTPPPSPNLERISHPLASPSKKHTQFHIPKPAEILRASAGMFKGVSAIGAVSV